MSEISISKSYYKSVKKMNKTDLLAWIENCKEHIDYYHTSPIDSAELNERTNNLLEIMLVIINNLMEE